VFFLDFRVTAPQHCAVSFIVIKPGPEIDPVKGPGPGFYGSTHKPGLFRGEVELKIKNRKGRQ
jgi:hypothetical protein